MPTYNGGRYLGESLDSILQQGVRDLEIIVGDDASTDDSAAVAEARRDPRLRLLRFGERAGLAGNWSRTVAGARGRYVALVGQDDRVEPFWAERLVGLLEAHPQADLAFGRRSFVFTDEHSRSLLGDFFERVYPAILEPFYSSIGTVITPDEMVGAAMRNCFEINLVGEPSFVMFRRDHAAVRAGFDANMWQMVDWEYFTRFFVDRPILHCADRLGTYRIHAGGASVDSMQQRRHHEEYHYLLGVVLRRFAALLDHEQTARLQQRRQEIRSA
ncbi:MAG: glycosyltransferase [Planctomycetes bacterium]|nr:glycosyltransferase [Planctomycetota bacterium]